MATAILIQKESGGNLAEVLDKTAHCIRQQFQLKRDVRTHTAQGRLTGLILTLLPVALGVMIYFVNPQMMSVLWTNPLGIKLIWASGHYDGDRRAGDSQNREHGGLRKSMRIAIFIFCDVFLLVACVLLFMSNRESVIRRLSEAIDLRPRRQRTLKDALQQTGSSLGGAMGLLEQVLPKSEKEKTIIQQRLVYAGFRKKSAVRAFYGAKVADSAYRRLLMTVTGLAKLNPFIFYLAAVGSAS